MDGVVISLCDLSCTTLLPWAEAGYQCYAIDIQHNGITVDGNITKVGADLFDCVSTWFPIGRRVIFACGFPPCTDTAVSGAKYFVAKGARGASEAFRLIARCEELLKWFQAPYFWEQPIATTSTYCGKPDYIFNPCDYAGYLADSSTDAYNKKTCLWTGNGFKMPVPKPVEAVKVCSQGSWIMKLGGKSERTKNLRSATPKGFARAVFEANHHP